MLKPQDILLLLKLVAQGEKSWSYSQLALSIGLSPSEAHAAMRRSLGSQLASEAAEHPRPNLRNLYEFLVHGIRYVFVPEKKEITRGLPTAYAGPPLNKVIVPADEPPPVWPHPEGPVRGIAFSPLYKSVPFAAMQDEKLYELLALVDAIRGGRARERKLAIDALTNRLVISE